VRIVVVEKRFALKTRYSLARPLLAPLRCAALVAGLCLSHAGAQGVDWQILTIEVPPIAFTGPNGQPTGFCVEVVQEIQRRIGNTLSIEVYPWTRAYDMGLKQQNVILVCPKRTDERADKFQWVGPLLASEANLYARRGSGVRIHSLDEAKSAGILVTRSAFTYEHLKSSGFTHLEAAPTSVSVVKMLMADRLSLMAVDQQELLAILKDAGVPHDAVELVYSLTPTRSFLTFPKNAPDAMVSKWQKALNEMKKDGSFKRLYLKWFAGDNALALPVKK
jgi:polar amino acid transport system substrate-binding protein